MMFSIGATKKDQDILLKCVTKYYPKECILITSTGSYIIFDLVEHHQKVIKTFIQGIMLALYAKDF